MFIENYIIASRKESKVKEDLIIQSVLEEIRENHPEIHAVFSQDNFEQVKEDLKYWITSKRNNTNLSEFNKLNVLYQTENWKQIALERISEYLSYEGKNITTVSDQNIKINQLYILWQAIFQNDYRAGKDFFLDFLYLFKQIKGSLKHTMEIPIEKWIEKHPTGLDPEIIMQRAINKERIIKILINKIDNQSIRCGKYKFPTEFSLEDKKKRMNEWWETRMFHLQFAIRDPELLNELLEYSLSEKTINLLNRAQIKGIPLFVNPYYLSLLLVNPLEKYANADRAIRDYIFVSEQLVDEFGRIKAWEKEDVIEKGKPNAAGWLLPNEFNVHRRYPEVAIFIPRTVGRACGGLCVSCQRMYDFQSRRLNFDLTKLKANKKWWDEMPEILNYFEEDTQLRDILITGGDALMSSNDSLERILDEIYHVALRKREANKQRPDGEKFAEIKRVRIGTRLLAYIPQRIGNEVSHILKEFKSKASKIGIEQFIIQTHFETAMEITPEVQRALKKIRKAGWIVTNQLVFIPAASRRGHTAKLRQILNENGVLSYYTFSVKGFRENAHNFSPNARSVQEVVEEKNLGKVPAKLLDKVAELPKHAEDIIDNINEIKKEGDIPFLATDRNLMNLPAVGKSLTFKTIGITKEGNRILAFDHDQTRNHSPVIHEMGKIIMVEPKSIGSYLRQQAEYGEDPDHYESIWGYSMGITEKRNPLFEYPDYPFKITNKLSNFKIS